MCGGELSFCVSSSDVVWFHTRLHTAQYVVKWSREANEEDPW
jgi:hypothetical protein